MKYRKIWWKILNIVILDGKKINEISKDLYDTFYDAACESNYLTFSSD